MSAVLRTVFFFGPQKVRGKNCCQSSSIFHLREVYQSVCSITPFISSVFSIVIRMNNTPPPVVVLTYLRLLEFSFSRERVAVRRPTKTPRAFTASYRPLARFSTEQYRTVQYVSHPIPIRASALARYFVPCQSSSSAKFMTLLFQTHHITPARQPIARGGGRALRTRMLFCRARSLLSYVYGEYIEYTWYKVQRHTRKGREEPRRSASS